MDSRSRAVREGKLSWEMAPIKFINGDSIEREVTVPSSELGGNPTGTKQIYKEWKTADLNLSFTTPLKVWCPFLRGHLKPLENVDI